MLELRAERSGAGRYPWPAMSSRNAVASLGRVLFISGLLILGFVGYQLWGTSVYEERQQNRLERQFREKVRSADENPPAPGEAPPLPPSGESLAILKIPKIGVERTIVEGVRLVDLRKGPGHYPETPLPGELGNAAIAGHRTTYGAPFNRLDELQAGDVILATTLNGTYRYRVTDKRIITPTQLEVLDPTTDARLTLTTCNPKFSARQRLVIVAALDTGASPTPVAPRVVSKRDAERRNTLDEQGLSGARPSKAATALWIVLTAAMGAIWRLTFRRWRRWFVWIAGALPFLAVLFVCYSYLERLVPSNF